MFSRRTSDTPKTLAPTGTSSGGSVKGGLNGKASTTNLLGMPEKKELDRQYLALLEELAIPESKRMVLMQSDDETKWKLVCLLFSIGFFFAFICRFLEKVTIVMNKIDF